VRRPSRLRVASRPQTLSGSPPLASRSARWGDLCEDDVPAQWKELTAASAAFFTVGEEPLGSPGGAANVGALVRDVAFVANYQVRDSWQPSHEPTWAGSVNGATADWRWVAVDPGRHPPM
jgi:hypothetical protein